MPSRTQQGLPPEGGNGEDALTFYGDGAYKFVLDNFFNASTRLVGTGPRACGGTYRAVMENGTTVAVKHLADVKLDEFDFFARMQAIGFVRHENIVQLRACHWSPEFNVVVYDYMPRGSLFSLLHGANFAMLNWNKRCSVALAAARGIQHIHSTGTESSHGNIKSSSILLCDSNYARVCQQGLNQLSSAPVPANVDGYSAPEVTDSRNVSRSADVYSFGVVLFELVTGETPSDDRGAFDLAGWLRSVPPENRMLLLDPELEKDENVHGVSMERVMNLAMDCTVPLGQRPSMSDVVVRLHQIIASSRQHQPPGEIEPQSWENIEPRPWEHANDEETYSSDSSCKFVALTALPASFC